MDWQQKQLGGLPETKPTTHMDESQDHKQLPPEPHGMPQKDALSEMVSKRGSSLHITSLHKFLRACLKAKPFSQGLRNPEQEDVCQESRLGQGNSSSVLLKARVRMGRWCACCSSLCRQNGSIPTRKAPEVYSQGNVNKLNESFIQSILAIPNNELSGSRPQISLAYSYLKQQSLWIILSLQLV